MPQIFQLRRGTAAEWEFANPILQAGEMGYETSTNRLKIGNGIDPWSSLAYVEVTELDWSSIQNKPASFPPDTSNQGFQDYVSQSVGSHSASTTSVHGIADTSQIIVEGDSRLTDARVPTEHGHDISDVEGLQVALDAKVATASLATVATSGSYSDLNGTPALGTAAATNATDYATSSQGALADSAVQPGDLATVATTGSYNDLTNPPTLGTASATDSTDYATAAQGSLADSAVQPGDLAAVATGGSLGDLSDVTDDTPAPAVITHVLTRPPGGGWVSQGTLGSITVGSQPLSGWPSGSIGDELAGKASTSHASTHATGGSDAIAPSDIGAAALTGATFTGQVEFERALQNTTNTRAVFVDTDYAQTTNATNYNFGIAIDARKSLSAGVTDQGYLLGLSADSYHEGAGTLNQVYGVRVGAGKRADSSGDVEEVYGIRASVLNLSNPAAGDIIDGYGVYVADVQATNAWCFYAASDDPNFFRGNVGIGASRTSPTSALDVNGDVTITDKIIHSGDSNTAIRFPAADTFTIETDGVERVRVGSTGIVYIGRDDAVTTNGQIPSLSLASSINFNAVSTDSVDGLYWSTTDSYSIARTSGSWTAPDYQQLQLKWITGIVLNPGAAYQKSFVDIQGLTRIPAATFDLPSIAFRNDPNTGISQAGGADTFSISTAGVERVRVDAAGRVGIGSANDFTALSATAGLSVGDGSSAGGLTVYTGTGFSGHVAFADGTTGINQYKGLIAYTHSLDAMRFFTQAVERMRIDSSGKVGIGTTDPATALDVNGVITVSAGSAAAPAIVASGDSNTGLAFGTDTLIFSTGGAERLRVESDGSVSARGNYGTNTPARIVLGHNQTISSVYDLGSIDWSDGTYVYTQISEETEVGTGGGGAGNLVFSTRDGSSLQERMRVRADGNLGLGVAGAANILFDGKTDQAFLARLESTNDYQTGLYDGRCGYRLANSTNGPFYAEMYLDPTAKTYGFGGSSSGGSLPIIGGVAQADIVVSPKNWVAFNEPALTPLGTASAPSVSIFGDPDTGTWSPGADQWAVSTSGVERLRIDSSGNVGIGATPSLFSSSFNNLVVGSGSAIEGATIFSTTQGTLAFGDTATNGVDGYRGYIAYVHTTDYMFIGTGGAERLRVNSAGLRVTGVIEVSAGSAAAPAIVASGDSNTGLLFPAADTVAISTAGVENVRVTSDGRLVVGATTSAAIGGNYNNTNAALTVSSAKNTWGNLHIHDNQTAAAGVGGQIVMSGCYNGLSGTARYGIITAAKENSTQGDYKGYFNVQVNDGTGLQERLRIDSSGNVGIDAASPTAKLDINADTIRLRTAKTPASSSDTGNAGDICWDSSYLYICTATNTWRRIAHSTW